MASFLAKQEEEEEMRANTKVITVLLQLSLYYTRVVKLPF